MSRNTVRLSYGGGRSRLSLNAADSLIARTQRLADVGSQSQSTLAWQVAAAGLGDVSGIAALASIAARRADEQIRVVQEVRAGRPRVFEAWTTPALIARWWGGRRGTIQEAEVDLRVGGAWRLVLVGRAGARSVFAGEFREIVPLQRIMWTQADWLITAEFAERDGSTRVSLLMHLPSPAAREAALRAGIEFAVRDQLTLLEEVAGSPTWSAP